MRFAQLAVEGAALVTLEPRGDERGAFARAYCVDEFAVAGIGFAPVQCNISRNPHAGTLRGMHFQAPPHEEAKLVQCVRGTIFDAIVDLRRGSPSFGRAAWAELSEDNDRLLYIPPGCAHGFLTRTPGADVFYYMGSRYVPGAERGVRWDDPALEIPWPAAPMLVSARDAGYPRLAELASEQLA